MSALISQLLTLARADQGRLNLEKEPIDLGELTQMVAAQTEELAAAKGIRVECRADAGLWVQGDETMLVRMLLNPHRKRGEIRPGGRLCADHPEPGRGIVWKAGWRMTVSA